MMNFFSSFRVANRTFAATKGQMSNKSIKTMNQRSAEGRLQGKNEQDFERQVRAAEVQEGRAPVDDRHQGGHRILHRHSHCFLRLFLGDAPREPFHPRD